MERYIKKFIEAIKPDRADFEIAGQHPSLAEWKSWYSGKTDRHYYSTIESGVKTTKEMLQSGFAKMVCEKWASSFMNERLKINVGKKNAQTIFDSILELNGVKAKINKFTEKYFALGLGAIVVVPNTITTVDGVVAKTGIENIKVRLIDAERVYPITIEDDDVTELAIVRSATNSATIQLHLKEDNGTYTIYEAQGIKSGSEYKFNFDEESIAIWETKSLNPFFTVWTPQVVDNKYLDNPLGTSIYADCSDELFTFDMIFDKFNTEFKNGGKKRFISADLQYIDGENGEAKSVALGEEDVYIPTHMDGQTMITEHSSDLRTMAFIQGLSFYANLIGKKCGLGDDAFSSLGLNQGGKPKQTATAEILQQQEAMINVRKNENFATIQFKRLALAIKDVYNQFVDGALDFDINDINVDFADNIVEDTTAQKEADTKLVAAGLMTIAEFRAKWMNKDIKEAEKDVQTNLLLLDKYILALQSKAITPELLIEKVYGNTITEEQKQELIANMQEQPVFEDNYGAE